jgi:hypothetical protein
MRRGDLKSGDLKSCATETEWETSSGGSKGSTMKCEPHSLRAAVFASSLKPRAYKEGGESEMKGLRRSCSTDKRQEKRSTRRQEAGVARKKPSD